MEGLLKLIVGVDGVTADAIVRLSYIYLATQISTTVGFVTVFLGMTAIICRTVKWCVMHG